MRAILCKQYGRVDDLVYQECPSPPLTTGQVRVKVAACGVNFPDSLIVEGKYQYKPEPPFSPGGEVIGTIIECAPDIRSHHVGDRVIAITIWGGYAEELVTTPERLLACPDSMDDVTAAGFVFAYGTSYHALVQRAKLEAGETLVVLGAAGGVGLAAVELGHQLGAHVIAVASTEEKLAVAREYGAKQTICYQGTEGGLKDRIREATQGAGADVIYDPVGGGQTEQALRAIAWNGRLLVVGFAAGDIPKIPSNLLLLKGCAMMGVFWGAFRDREAEANRQNFVTLFAWQAAGRLRPRIDRTYPLAEARQALADIRARKVKGKLVLVTG